MIHLKGTTFCQTPKRAEYLNSLILKIPPNRAKEIIESYQQAAFEKGVWIESSERKSPIQLAIRPRIMTPFLKDHIHHVCRQVRLGLLKMVDIYFNDPRARGILPFEESELKFISDLGYSFDCHSINFEDEHIFCRLDAFINECDVSGSWNESFKIMESNHIGVGGGSYLTAVESSWIEKIFPSIKIFDNQIDLRQNDDPRQLLVDELINMAIQRGIQSKSKILVAFVDNKRIYTLKGEFGRLVPYFNSIGIDAVYADPRELEESLDHQHVTYKGREIDLIYRFLEIREILEIEQEEKMILKGMRLAFKKKIVLPSIAGEFEHKSTLEVMTSEMMKEHFSDSQNQIFSQHILWTRLLFDRKTQDPNGENRDLIKYCRENKNLLVLKPNRGYGGEGVVVGPFTSVTDWERALDQAIVFPRSYVVQKFTAPNCQDFPILDMNGDLSLTRYYCTGGFFPGMRGHSIFGRYSKREVVNIHSGGGINPFLVDYL